GPLEHWAATRYLTVDHLAEARDGLGRVEDDPAVDEMWQGFKGPEIDLLGIDQEDGQLHCARLLEKGTHDRGQEAQLHAPGGSGDEKVRQPGQIGDSHLAGRRHPDKELQLAGLRLTEAVPVVGEANHFALAAWDVHGDVVRLLRDEYAFRRANLAPEVGGAA